MFKSFMNSIAKSTGVSDELAYRQDIRMRYAFSMKDQKMLELEKQKIRRGLGGESKEGRIRLQYLDQIRSLGNTFKGLSEEEKNKRLAEANDKDREFFKSIIKNYKG